MEADRAMNPPLEMGRDASKYNAAFDVLSRKIEALENTLRDKLMKNLKRVSKEDTAQIQDKLRVMTLANRYRMVSVGLDKKTTGQLIVTLSAAVDQQDESSLLSIAKVRIGDSEAKPSMIDKNLLTVPIPAELQKSGPQGISLLIGDVGPGKIISIDLK